VSRIFPTLLKYTSRDHVPREDFTTTCLAELMRRDRLAAHVVLKVLGLIDQVGSDLTHRTIHTQVRLSGSQKRPDLSVSIGIGASTKRVLIEAKVWSPPYAAQVRHYANLGRCPVALLAPEARLPLHDDQGWAGVPRGSWEAIAEGLRDENARLDPDQVPAFRADFLSLMEELGIGGLRRLSPVEFRAASGVTAATPEWVSFVAQGVRELLPEGASPAPTWATNTDTSGDEARWGSTQPLDAWWSAPTGPHPGLLGLGLSGWAVGTRSAPALAWILSVRPTPETLKRCHSALKAGGAWNTEGEWWWVYLADQLDPDRPLAAGLREAVTEARAVLRDELAIEAELPEAAVELSGGAEALRTIHAGLEVQQRASQALGAAIQAIMDRLLRGLNARIGVKARRVATREPRIEISRDGGNSVYIGATSWLADRPGIIVWTAWGGKKRKAELTPLFAQGDWGVADAHPGPKTNNLDLVLHVGDTPLVHATIDALVNGWLARFDEHRDRILAPGGKAE
jgi:hypothetical protein